MLVLAGCRDILSLDDVPPPPPGSEVTGRYVFRALSNNAQHEPIVTEYPVQAFAASAALADGSVVEVAIGPDGTFAFHSTAEDDRYRLRFVTTRGTHEIQHSARHLELAQAISPLDSQSVGDNTTVTYALNDPPPSANATPVLRSTGSWSQPPPGTRVTQDGYMFTWPAGYPRLRAEKYDRLFFTFDDTSANASLPYRSIVRYRYDDVTIQNGVTNAVSNESNRVGLMSVQRNRCMRVRVDFTTMIERLQSVYSLGVPLAAAWYVVDVPDPTLGFFGAHPVAYATATSDVEADIDFGDPFSGVNGYTGQVLFARTLKAGGTSKTLPVGTHVYALPATGSCGNSASSLPEIALPSTPRVAGSELAGTDTTVMIDRSAPVAVDWSIASPGYVDYWQVSLIELTGTSLDFGKTITYSTIEPSLAIDPRDLVLGKTYVLQIMPTVGFAGAVEGDFATRSYPALTHTAYSATFTIAN